MRAAVSFPVFRRVATGSAVERDSGSRLTSASACERRTSRALQFVDERRGARANRRGSFGLPPEPPVRAGFARGTKALESVLRLLLGMRGLFTHRRFGLAPFRRDVTSNRTRVGCLPSRLLRRQRSQTLRAFRLGERTVGQDLSRSWSSKPRRVAPRMRAAVSFPVFRRVATGSAVEPRSRRLFKAPRRSTPERVPSTGPELFTRAAAA